MATRMMYWVAGASATNVLDATLRKAIIDRGPTHLVLNAAIADFPVLVAAIKAQFPTLIVLQYFQSERLSNNGLISATYHAAIFAKRWQWLLIKRSNGQPKYIGSKQSLWLDITNAEFRTWYIGQLVASLVANGADGLAGDNYHAELDPETPYAGRLDLEPLTTMTSVVSTRGATQTLALVMDGAGAGSLSHVGVDYTYHYSATTTRAQFEAGMAANVAWWVTLADPTPAALMVAGDAFVAQTLLGGADLSTVWGAELQNFTDELRAALTVVDPTYFLHANGVWNHHYPGQAAIQAALCDGPTGLDGMSIEFFGFNPTNEVSADPYTRFVDEIAVEIAARPTKYFIVRGSTTNLYYDYQVHMYHALYCWVAFNMLAVDNPNAAFQFADSFQILKLASQRWTTAIVHSFYNLNLGNPIGAAVNDGSGAFSREFDNAILYIAPEKRGLHLFTLPWPAWTSGGQSLPAGTVIGVREGFARAFLKVQDIPPVMIEAMADPVVAADPSGGNFSGAFASATNQPVELTYETTEAVGVSKLVVTAEFSSIPGVTHDVFDGVDVTGFEPDFNNFSTIDTSDPTQWSLSVRRDAGWPLGRLTFNIREADIDGEFLIDRVAREHRYTRCEIRTRTSDVAAALQIRGETDDPAGAWPFLMLTIKPAGGAFAPGTADRPYKGTTTIAALQALSPTALIADGVWRTQTIMLDTACAPYTMWRPISAKTFGTIDIDYIRFYDPVSIVPLIDPTAPIAAFSAVVTLLHVAFTDDSHDSGSIVAWDWDFGDGSPHESTQNPSHDYAYVGDYTVTLIAEDDQGNTDTFTKVVSPDIVTDGPLAWRIAVTPGDFAALGAPGTANRVMPPQSSYPLQTVAGNPQDVIRALHLTANGAPTYNEVIDWEGWTGTGLGMTGVATQRASVAAASGPIPTTTPSMIVAIVRLRSPPINGGVFNLGTNNSVRHTTDSVIRHVVNSPTQIEDGTEDYGGVYLICLDNDPRADAGGVGTAGRARAQTNLEYDDGVTNNAIEALPYADPADGTKGLGGIVPTNSFVGVARNMWWWYALSFTAANGTDTLTVVAHNWMTGDGPAQVYNVGGGLPAGYAPLTDYWIIRLTADTFKLAASQALALAGTPVNITTDGTGVNSIKAFPSFYTFANAIRALDVAPEE